MSDQQGVPDPASEYEVIAAGYQDWTEIGRGGFGVVYRARDTRFRRDVAIKVLSGVLSDDARARFLRECEAVGSLSGHPGIVSVHDMGFSDDGRTTYLVMEHLPAGTLAERAAGSGLPWQEAVQSVVTVAGALESAHRAGVLHRDVKPENVLFTSFGAAKIVDFGIATVGGGYETRSAAVTASLAHAAPEVVGGERATAASDTYSLASTLFFALTGSAPFASDADETLIPLIARISTQPVPDLRRAGVPDEVAAAVERAMAKDPAQRTGSPLALAEDLVAAAGRSGATLAAPVVVAPAPPRADPQQATAGQTQVVGRRREPQPVPAAAPTADRRRTGRRALVSAAVVVGVLSLAGIGWAVVGGSAQPAASEADQSGGTDQSNGTDQSGGADQSNGTDPLGGADPSSSGSPSQSSPPGAATPQGAYPTDGQIEAAPGGQGPAAGASGSAADSASAPSAGTGAAAKPQQAPQVAQPQPNRAPVVAPIPNRTSEESTAQSLALAATDPDGDPVTFTVTGLPAGLSGSSSGVISGKVSHDAASVTQNRTNVKAKAFTVTVTASDGTATSARVFTWTINDTHRTMPDYFGKYGCNGDPGCSESVPNVAAISLPSFGCTTSGASTPSTIVRQSVAAGSVIRWGQPVTYTYREAKCA